jgi:hypothetical protein
MRRLRGLTLIEVVFAISFLGLGLFASLALVQAGAAETNFAKELEAARLGASRAREALRSIRFRALNATEVAAPAPVPSLFRGAYEIGRTAPVTGFPNGQSFLMPDVRAVATVTVDGVSGCVVVQFPVPPLRPLAGRTQPGRLVLYVVESGQDDGGPLPSKGFPFPPTPGLAGLDCDANGAIDATDLRTRHAVSGTPAGVAALRCLPVKIIVEWRSTGNTTQRYESSFLLSYPGYN